VNVLKIKSAARKFLRTGEDFKGELRKAGMEDRGSGEEWGGGGRGNFLTVNRRERTRKVKARSVSLRVFLFFSLSLNLSAALRFRTIEPEKD